MDPMLLEALAAAAIAMGSPADAARDAAWRRGDTSFLFHAGQRQIDDVFEKSPHQMHVILCARGYGKTFWGAAKSSGKGVKRKSRIKIATEFKIDLESLILPNFEAVLETCPADIAPKWMPSKNRYVCPNGSIIDLIGLDKKPRGLRGQHNVDMILLEEAGFITKLEEIYRSVLVPITTHRKDCKIVLLSTPPESVDHYFWELVEIAKQAGALTVLTIDDNPMLTKEDIKRIEIQMGGRESTQFRREYLCEKVSEENRLLIPEFKEATHTAVPERDIYFPFYLKSSALDSGVRDLTVAHWAYYDFKRAQLIVEDELVLGGKDVLTSHIFRRTREIESHLDYKKVRRHADNNNLILIQDLNLLAHEAKLESGFTIKELQALAEIERLPAGLQAAPEFVHWVPTSKDSVEASINLLREWLKNDRVLIHPRCKHTIGTVKTALWNKQRTDFQRSSVYGHADAIMALVYLIRNVDQHTNPIPHTFGADLANSFIIHRPTQSESARALGQAFSTRKG